MMRSAICILLLASAAPAFAQVDPLAPISTPEAPPPTVEPLVIEPAAGESQPTAAPLLPPIVMRPVPRDWRGVFDAIRAEDWGGVVAGINALPDGPLKPVAKAEYYTAKNGPRTELGPILALLAEAPDLPQAEQLQRLAMLRGAIEPPPIVVPRPTIGLPMAPRRGKARPVSGEPAADALRLALDPLVKVDDAAGAEALFQGQSPFLSPEARAEAAQRVAFIYYVLGRDADVRRVADQGRAGATGEWGAQAAWVSGLAAWRMSDFAGAQAAFADALRLGRDVEFAATAAYWAARAAQAGRRPRDVQPLLLAAARSQESFYGLLARETLGMTTTLPAPRRLDPNSAVARSANVRRATELIAIGERALAEQMLRHQAKIGRPADQQDLIAVARSLNLGGAQFWLAHNGQPGTRVAPADRYPAPRWNPERGWRIDPALAYAHIIQESNFRAEAVSPAGAIGLMQVRPGTAGDTARSRGEAFSANWLKRPETNLDLGQAYIELIRGSAATRGQLPKVIAAYNAGPVPVERWQAINDKGDPLLWIESLPYWETRYYVPAVLRNMWVYQGLAGAPQPTLRALAEHRWPTFPTTTTRLAR
jgi:soluble lytic murein transglycosylase-like protein